MASKSFSLVVLAAVAGICLSPPVLAAERAGKAIGVDPNVDAVAPGGGRRLLKLEGAVFRGDEIVAGRTGMAQIRFVDDTRLVVGPNSRLRIDSFVFNPDDTARQVTISMAKGAFRFITGKSSKKAYTLNTPTGTLGIRGTVFDLFASEQDATAIVHEGAVEACDRKGACALAAAGNCEMYVFAAGGGIDRLSAPQRSQRMSEFPWIAATAQAVLDPAFRTDTASCQ